MDRRRVFILGGKVGYVRSQGLVPYRKIKNAITRQSIIISTSNMVRIMFARVDAFGILYRSVSQINRK